MTRDWHAIYLGDPDVMAAAQARAAHTGEDGYAIAAELAKTLPPRFSSHEAAGARAVIAPSADVSDSLSYTVFGTFGPAEIDTAPPRGNVLTAVPDPAQLPPPQHATYAEYAAAYPERAPSAGIFAPITQPPRTGCGCGNCQTLRAQMTRVQQAQHALANENRAIAQQHLGLTDEMRESIRQQISDAFDVPLDELPTVAEVRAHVTNRQRAHHDMLTDLESVYELVTRRPLAWMRDSAGQIRPFYPRTAGDAGAGARPAELDAGSRQAMGPAMYDYLHSWQWEPNPEGMRGYTDTDIAWYPDEAFALFNDAPAADVADPPHPGRGNLIEVLAAAKTQSRERDLSTELLTSAGMREARRRLLVTTDRTDPRTRRLRLTELGRRVVRALLMERTT